MDLGAVFDGVCSDLDIGVRFAARAHAGKQLEGDFQVTWTWDQDRVLGRASQART